jgi:sugar lactone lactonase YvrE
MKPGFTQYLFGALTVAALVGALTHLAADEAPTVGTLVIVAGTGPRGLTEDGGPATQARLYFPLGVAVDAAGNLFFSETLNHRIRKVGTDGILTTLAGSGLGGLDNGEYAGDGGPGKEARLNYPVYLALDGTGNLLFADRWNSRVRMISPEGIITTVAGIGKDGFAGDGGPATAARVKGPHGVAFDGAGNLFIADTVNQRIRKVTPDGIITTIAGDGKEGFAGDGGPATAARFNSPQGLAVDLAGNLFIADLFNQRIRKISLDGTITTVAGSGPTGTAEGTGAYAGDGGPATEARLNLPVGVAVDTVGNLFIADWSNNRIRKVSPDGIITTVAGSDKKTFSGAGGPATEAGLRGPSGVAVDAAGNLFITDSGAFKEDDTLPDLGHDERVVKVIGVAAPGLLAGKPFPKPQEP